MTDMAGFFDDLGKRLSETANDLGKKAEDTHLPVSAFTRLAFTDELPMS